MDQFLSSFADIGIIAAIGTVIAFLIQALKAILKKFKWYPSIPGEVWFILSLAIGVGIAFALRYNVVPEALGAPIAGPEWLNYAITGAGMGAAAKVTHDVASPVGKELAAKKEEAIKKLEPSPIEPLKEVEIDSILSEPLNIPLQEVMLENFIDNKEPEVMLIKRVKSNPEFVVVDGKIYSVKE